MNNSPVFSTVFNESVPIVIGDKDCLRYKVKIREGSWTTIICRYKNCIKHHVLEYDKKYKCYRPSKALLGANYRVKLK